MFSPDKFFHLENFSHKDLFLEDQPIWETLKNLTKYLEQIKLGKIECVIPSSTILLNPDQILIRQGSIIEPGCCIQGPCIIGEQSIVRYGAHVRPYVITGKGCVIGHSSEIKHSILLNFSCAPHYNYVGDSILGEHVNLGAGVKCANVLLNKKEVRVNFKGQYFRTGLKKFGSIVGDRCQIGCNSVINPGTILARNTFIRPCSSVR